MGALGEAGGEGRKQRPGEADVRNVTSSHPHPVTAPSCGCAKGVADVAKYKGPGGGAA